MPPKVGIPPILISSSRFMAVVAALAMGITGEPSPIFLSVFVFLLLLGFFTQRKNSFTDQLQKWQPYMAVFWLLIAGLDFFQISKSFLLSIAHFLLGLQGVRLLTIRTPRDVIGGIFLSSMMILSAATFSVEWTFFTFLIVFLFVVVWTLIVLTISTEAQVNFAKRLQETGSDVELKKVAAGLSSESFLDVKSPVWSRLMPVVRRATLIAFLTAFVCCSIVFFLFPRFHFRTFRGQMLQPVHRSGFTEQVDLRKDSRIFEDDTVAMRIEIEPEMRQFWPGYVRGTTLEVYDGESWTSKQDSKQQTHHSLRGEIRVPYKESKDIAVIAQNIYLESMNSPVIFAAPMPIGFDISRVFLKSYPDGSYRRSRNDTWRVHYTAYSAVRTSEINRMVSDQSSLTQSLSVMSANLTHVPSREMKLRFKGMADSLLQSNLPSLQKARDIERHFLTNFSYSLDAAKDFGSRPLESFVFETRQGHCEYFAAAMIMVLRSIDIPSRMVTGFYAHEWNNRGNYYVIRMRDAHAWVEAYIPGRGWMMFDPTPRQFISDQKPGFVIQQWRAIVDYLNLNWNRYVLSYDLNRQMDLALNFAEKGRRLEFDMKSFKKYLAQWKSLWKSNSDKSSSTDTGSVFSMGGLNWAFILMGISFIAVLGWLILKAKKKDIRVWFYPDLIFLLEKRAGEKPTGQTLREFVESKKQFFQDIYTDLVYLLDIYYQIRFRPQPDEPDRKEIQNLVRRLKKAS